MSAGQVEAFLARLYTDADFRKGFLDQPSDALQAFDLTAEEATALNNMDREGLILSARSFETKRAHGKTPQPKAPTSFFSNLRKWIFSK